MNANWRERRAKAHARYGNVKDRIDRCDGFNATVFDSLNAELEEAEAELKALDTEFRRVLSG